jgi:hypothetical protein
VLAAVVRRGLWFLLVSTMLLAVSAPSALAWDRAAAQIWAHLYDGSHPTYQAGYTDEYTFANRSNEGADVHSSDWPFFPGSLGGDCTNFVSQCLRGDILNSGTPDGHGGIKPVTIAGAGMNFFYIAPNTGWYMVNYANQWWTGVDGDWKLANAFHYFWKTYEPYKSNRILYQVGDFQASDATWPTPTRDTNCLRSSVASYDEDYWKADGTQNHSKFTCNHVAIVLHANATDSAWWGCSDMTPGTVVGEHGDRTHVFWTKADVYRHDPNHRDTWCIALWTIDNSVE